MNFKYAALGLLLAIAPVTVAQARGFGGYHARSYSSSGTSEHYTSGYTRRTGTYVAPHYATNPNGTKMDNWSTQGNMNPHTGRMGTKSPY